MESYRDRGGTGTAASGRLRFSSPFHFTNLSRTTSLMPIVKGPDTRKSITCRRQELKVEEGRGECNPLDNSECNEEMGNCVLGEGKEREGNQVRRARAHRE